MFRLLFILLLALAPPARAAIPAAPDRDEGEGPWPQLILRGATVITGTGAPAYGPVDIVIEGDRIVDVVIVGTANHPIDPDARPTLKPGGREMDLAGQYVMPGIVDMHGHIGGEEQGVTAEYVYKLWLAHGITTVRDPGCGNGIDWCVSESRRSEAGRIAAPRIFPYVFFGMGHDGPITTPAQARAWVRSIAKAGALGMWDPLESTCRHASLSIL